MVISVMFHRTEEMTYSFNKDVGEFNVKTFFSLIQADGYNPLEVRPSLFNIKEGKEDEVKAYVADSISGDATAIQNIVAR